MTTISRAFIDTNVLLRAITVATPLHHEADELIKTMQERGYELWISRQVIREFIVQVTRPQAYQQPLTVEQVCVYVQTIQTLFTVADDTARVTAHLLTLLQEFPTGGKQVHDANIVATMLTYGIDTLLTGNVEDMKRFEGKIKLIPLVKETT
jgi:predicted nucleic acid-binding protein